MKILVSVKRTIDYNAKIRIKPDGSDVDLSNTKMSTNPFCEIAVEEAVRLKEMGAATEVIVVSVGPDSVIEQIRSSMAMGADRGIHIKTEFMPDSLEVARLLAKLVEVESPDLIIMGKQSIDTDNNQTGQMLAALLGFPQGTFASKLVFDNKKIAVTREIDGGLQTISLVLPAIVTTDLRLNEPRYSSLPNIMKAKRKPIETKKSSDLSVDLVEHSKLIGVSYPPERKPGIKVSSVDELLDKLKNEVNIVL